MTIKTSIASLDNSLIEEFRNTLHGEMILPHDENYEIARKVFNGMIVRCINVADAIYTVNFGRINNPIISSALIKTLIPTEVDINTFK